MRLITLTMDLAVEVEEAHGGDPSKTPRTRLEDIARPAEREIEMFVPTVVVKGRRVGDVKRVACVRSSEQ
jgi:hypothetical protein